MTIAELRKSIASNVEDYVVSTVNEWYSQHPDVGEPSFTLSITHALISGLFIGYDVAQHIDNDQSYRKDIATAVASAIWDRYVKLTLGEHDAAWEDLRDLVDGTYELLYGNTVADWF